MQHFHEWNVKTAYEYAYVSDRDGSRRMYWYCCDGWARGLLASLPSEIAMYEAMLEDTREERHARYDKLQALLVKRHRPSFTARTV